MTPEQRIFQEIGELIRSYGIFGIISFLLIIALAILWILLPLAIYPLYGAIRRSNRQLQLLNIKIDQMVKNQIENKEPL